MATIFNQQGQVYSNILEMYTHICIECGVPFAIPKQLDDRLRQTRESFYCPNGHHQHYVGKTEAEKIREQAEREKKILQAQLNEANRSKEYWNSEYKHQRQRAITAKAQKTRLANRVKNGVCPCCNRSFTDLAAHMQTKHPDFNTDTK